MTPALWMRRLLPAAVALCFIVVVLGAYVRLSAAGLGCPDWPGCYGHLSPIGAEHAADANAAWAARPLEPGKAWREMVHRYAVSVLAVLIVLIAALALAGRRQRIASVPLALALCAVLLAQALLGMLTVTWKLNPPIVTAHLLLGLATLGLLWWLLLTQRRSAWAGAAPGGGGPPTGAAGRRLARRLLLVGLAALALQIALGGWTSSNYAALACPDLPTCQGAWWPHTDYAGAFVLWRGLGIDYEGGVLASPARVAIHLTHRIGALVAAASLALAALCVLRSRGLARVRALAWVMLAALGLQLAIGISMVLRAFPLWLATAHTAGAALLLLAALALLRALGPR